MYVTSHKKPFVPSVWDIGLLYNVQAEGKGPFNFVKRLQMSLTGKLISLGGCGSFCEKCVVRGREF